jgi:hypothetical protein
VKIVLLIEGKTERAFLPTLRVFLETRLADKMPRLDPAPYDGLLAKGDKLKRHVELHLKTADAVIALTDVYTGKSDFVDARDAKQRLCEWVGRNPRFYAHAAQYEFEAWLLPFWPTIQRLAGHNMGPPASSPESVNHLRPPSTRIKEIFRVGSRGGDYVKTRDAQRILRDKNLEDAAKKCPELTAFLNTILRLCGGTCL